MALIDLDALVFACGSAGCAALICVSLVCLGICNRTTRTRIWWRQRRPPGPRGHWFTGVKNMLPSTEPWKRYAEWSVQYESPVISFRVYNRTIVVLNSLSSIRALLDQRATIYSERPMSLMYNVICARGQAVFNVSASDPRHRVYRRLLQTGLSKKATEESWGIMQQEASILLRGLMETPEKWTQHVRRNAAGLIMKLAFGYSVKGLDDSFIAIADESAKISGWALAPGRWMVDYYPILRFIPSYFPGAGWKRQGQIWRDQLSHLSDVPYRWTISQIEKGIEEESFISRLLRGSTESSNHEISQDEEDAIKWCAGGLYAGAADTTVSALTSFILLMALYPDVQRKAQAELACVFHLPAEARDRHIDVPSPTDLQNASYLMAILKEVLRYAPVANLALSHCLAEDDTYAGFDLPKGASVVPNVWAIMHDDDLYPKPNEFIPERFLEAEFPSEDCDQHQGQPDPRQFSYGFGRRLCPGMHFAETILLLNMASILMHFNITVSGGTQPQVQFTTGITSHIKPFPVGFEPRSLPSV